MRNVHTRLFAHPLALVRSWLDLAWSDSRQDIFPRDVIRGWRANPDGSTAWIPDVTLLGHGPFVFKLRWWDGVRWRADLDANAGSLAFHLAERGGKTRLGCTFEASLPLASRLAIVPIHDWAVEAMFDRLAIALATGSVPHETARPMGFVVRRMLDAMRDRRGLGSLAMGLR